MNAKGLRLVLLHGLTRTFTSTHQTKNSIEIFRIGKKNQLPIAMSLSLAFLINKISN